MAVQCEVLADFPGFAVEYDPSANPFFRPIVVENLKRLKSVDTGKTLLDEIGKAKPRERSDFPAGINVKCVPTQINFTQSGFKVISTQHLDGKVTKDGMQATDQKQFAPPGCPFWIAGGSANQPVDADAATNGTGTVCVMKFSNAQIITNKGEPADPYIVLGHELIHSLHALGGQRKKERSDEEHCTTGIGAFVNEAMSENALRKEFGLPLRNAY